MYLGYIFCISFGYLMDISGISWGESQIYLRYIYSKYIIHLKYILNIQGVPENLIHFVFDLSLIVRFSFITIRPFDVQRKKLVLIVP